MKKMIVRLFVLGSLIAFPLLMTAQPNPGQNSGSTPVGGNPIGGGAAPLDGGISLLLVAAAGYGVSRSQINKYKLSILRFKRFK